MGHATPWNPSRAGIAPTACSRLAPGRQDLSVRGLDLERFHKLRSALGPEFSERRGQGLAAQASVRSSAAVGVSAETKTVAAIGARTSGSGIRNGFVDLAAHFQADRQTFRGSLPSRPSLAGDGGLRTDLAETGTTRHTEGRKSHRPLEETRVAGYKKKPEDLVPISHSSTKADFSSSLTSAKPGRRLARLLSSGTATSEIGFPQSPLSRYPPRAIAWGFTSVSIARTSLAWRSSDSCGTCFSICGGRWCCSGTAALSTSASSSKNSCTGTNGFMFSPFHRMRQRSIRRSSSGPRPSALSPMGRPRTSPNSDAASAAPSIAFAAPRGCCAPAFTPLICHGRNAKDIH